MRKTLNINLGGMAFIIDENAFELLNTYLEALKRKFNNEAERAEIMNDIESRVAELLGQRLKDRREVIGIDDVQFVTDALGKPEDIAGEETEATGTTSAQNQASATTATAAGAPVKKRLFRDPDDAKVGGVISGLCHYFGIADPVWARIIALILIFFTAGNIIWIYVLLLIIVPKATTAAEKLQMKGEPVNINTIEKEIKEAAGRAGESVQNFVKDQNIFERLWDATLSILKAFSKIFAVGTIFFTLLFLICVAVCFFAFFVLGSTPFNSASHMLVDSPSIMRYLSFGILLFLGAPAIALIYLCLKVLLGQRSRMSWLKWILLGGWVVGVALMLISSVQIVDNIRVQSSKTISAALMQPTCGNLYVLLTDTTGKKYGKDWDDMQNETVNFNGRSLFINGTDFNDVGRIPIGRPSLQLMPSENDSFYLQEIITAHGRNNDDALKNADMVVYSFSISDSVLGLNHTIYLDKTSKYRGQNIKLRIAIPKGKQIHFADNIDLWSATVKGDANYDDTYFNNTTWTNEDGKLKCIAGENHKNAAAEESKATEKQDKLEKKLKKVEEKLDKLDGKEHKANKDKDDDDDKDNDEKSQDF